MARLQILELPEVFVGEASETPFVLVVDETVPQRVVLGGGNPTRDYWQDIAQQIGARGVIVTPETVDIPANDLSAYLGEDGDRVDMGKAHADLVHDLITKDPRDEAIERVRQLHRPVEHHGQTICAECSAWDGSTTDNSPCGYEHCPTLKALAGYPASDA